MIIIEPVKTGLSKKSNDTLPTMTIMGFPPAGGWVTLNKIIKPTPKPTAKGIIIKIGNGTKCKTIKPTTAVIRCPNNTFFGCAKGLSGYPKSKTIEEPNEASKNNPNSVL